MSAKESPFIFVPDVATLLRVSVWQVYMWARNTGPDAMPVYRGGKRLLFDPDEVLAWFRRTQRKAATARTQTRKIHRLRRTRELVTAEGGTR